MLITRDEAEELAKRLKRLREHHHIFQRQLADMLGVTERTVRNIEKVSHFAYPKILEPLAIVEAELKRNLLATEELKGLE